MKKELAIFERHGQLYTDSRDVAAVVGQRHRDLLRTIRHYIKVMKESNERNFAPVDYFRESAYMDTKGETRPYYLITRKGCDMIAHKLTGDRGIWFTAAYIDRFYVYEQALRERNAPLWRLAREEGKKTRRLETDAIKMFVAYAQAHGSRNPDKYYMAFTKLAYSVTNMKAGQRDSSTAAQLMDLRTIEGVIDRGILVEIVAGTEYHQAFQNVKIKVLQVAALALSEVLALPQKTA